MRDTGGSPARVLSLEELAEPSVAPGCVTVRVWAAALNFSDILLCEGTYQERPPTPFTPGAEAAGTVVEVGGGVDLALAPGRRVISLPRLPSGAFSEVISVPASEVFPIPEAMPAEEAAAMHINFQTAHFALHRRARLEEGETVLVHSGAGGVGSAAVQLAGAAGARVIATARGEERVRICREMGAEVSVDRDEEDFAEVVREETGGRGADVIVDPVGGDVFDASRRCVAFEGRIVVVGFSGGRIPDAPVNHVLVKNYCVMGLHFGLYEESLPKVVRETHDRLLDLHRLGDIKPLIGRVVAFEEIPEALESMKLRRHPGKLVATFGGR